MLLGMSSRDLIRHEIPVISRRTWYRTEFQDPSRREHRISFSLLFGISAATIGWHRRRPCLTSTWPNAVIEAYRFRRARVPATGSLFVHSRTRMVHFKRVIATLLRSTVIYVPFHVLRRYPGLIGTVALRLVPFSSPFSLLFAIFL